MAMKSLKFIILFILSTLLLATTQELNCVDLEMPSDIKLYGSHAKGPGRILCQQTNQRTNVTCDNFPQICRAKNSEGPDCCQKKCVNIMKDYLNCGSCGRKCKHPEICHEGKCINVTSGTSNYGSCPHKCKHPEVCCKKKCVNEMKDIFNCGSCGHKCKYPEVCCKGKCVNIMIDPQNCGECNKQCKKGKICIKGMCSDYA